MIASSFFVSSCISCVIRRTLGVFSFLFWVSFIRLVGRFVLLRIRVFFLGVELGFEVRVFVFFRIVVCLFLYSFCLFLLILYVF